MLHANFGGSDHVATRWAAEHTRSLYFETSATNEPAFIARLAGWAGRDRIFYGSDWPWLPPRLEMAMVECSGLPQADIDRIMGESAAVMLGL
jgi:predicted TIM-barrel fold metal-dependent hydrolase